MEKTYRDGREREDLVRIENEERRRTCSIPTWPEPESPPSPPSFFSLFFSDSSPTKSHTLVFFSQRRIHVHTDERFLSFFLFAFYSLVLPFTILLSFVASSRVVSAGRSAPDYLGSECLIEALYRYDELLTSPSVAPSTPLLKFGGERYYSFSLSFPLTFSSSSFSFLLHLHIFTFIRLFAGGWYLITATDPPISATFSETHNAPLLGGWAAASPGHRRQAGKRVDEDEAASGAGTHILCVVRTTSSFHSLSIHVVSSLCLFPLSTSTLRRK